MKLILTVISEKNGKNTFKFNNFNDMDVFINKKYQNKKELKSENIARF